MQNLSAAPTLTEEQIKQILRRMRRTAYLKSGLGYIFGGLFMALMGMVLSVVVSGLHFTGTVIYVGAIVVGLINVLIGISRLFKSLCV